MAEVGFGTGCLYKNRSVNEAVDDLIAVGSEAVELLFNSPENLLQFKINKELIKKLDRFSYVSIHGPWRKTARCGHNEHTKKTLTKLRDLCSALSVKAIVVHPNTVDDFDILEDSELPFLIENMDKRRGYWTHPKHFREIKDNYSLGFVLDVQHAYEHDSKMELARKLLDVYGDRLKEMHVSGSNSSSSHYPVSSADNRKQIEEVLSLNLDVPKIAEGEIVDDIQKNLKIELQYLKSFETR